jgi:iron complex outermembrane recepter protein
VGSDLAPPSRQRLRLRSHVGLTVRAAAFCCCFHVAQSQAQSLDSVRQTSAMPASNEVARNDIIVTARGRPESLQDVPATLAALEPETLAKSGIVTLEQVAEQTPGFFVTKLGDLRPRLYVRGVGTREYDPGSESSVGIFFDDMYIGRLSSVLSSLEDIERIEILKGPQTTLYGRNTIGGAINIVSKAPTEMLSASSRAGYGNFGTYSFFGAISDALGSDKVLGRLMAYRSKSEGYITNLSTGHRSNGYDNWGGRGTLMLKPSIDVRITIVGDLSRRSGPSVDAKNVGSPTDPGGTFFSASTIGLPSAARPIAIADPFADYYNRDSNLQRRTSSLIGKAELDTPAGTFATITAYRYSNFFETRDFDATSLDAIAQTIVETSKQFTQELRFTSAKDGPLSLWSRVRWIAGLFYYQDRTRRSDRFDFGPASISAVRTGSPQNDIFGTDFETHSWAAFGSATVNLTGHLALSAGVRYTNDRKRLVQTDAASRPGSAFIVANFTSPEIRRDSDAWTPNVSLSYSFSDDLLAYATYNRGYKGGGYQYIPTNVAAAQTTFKPERSDAYETGVKAQFWDARATLNIAGFYYDYYDLQVQRSTTLANGAIAIVTNNASKSILKGIDVHAAAKPARSLTLRAEYSYLNARYKTYFNNPPGQPLTAATDFSNTPIIRSPRHSFNVALDYALNVGKGQLVTFRTSWNYRSEFFFEPGGGNPIYGTAIPLTKQKGFGLFNLSVSYDFRGTKVQAFANNLFNRFYLNDVQKLPFNYVLNFPGQPRAYGLSVSHDF